MVVPFSSVKPFTGLGNVNLPQPLPRVKLNGHVYFIDARLGELREVYNPSDVIKVNEFELQYYLTQAKKQAFSGFV